jgi:hypothetical protein
MKDYTVENGPDNKIILSGPSPLHLDFEGTYAVKSEWILALEEHRQYKLTANQIASPDAVALTT